MNRRKSLELIAGVSPVFMLPLKHEAGKEANAYEWLKNFKNRWNNSRTYCFEVLYAIPSSDFNFQPHPEMMSFANLFSHIGNGLNIYAEVLVGTGSDDEPESDVKADLTEYLADAFDHFDTSLDGINLDDLYTIKHTQPGVEPWREFSIFDIITLGYNHTIHHVAQATVYLRIKNIVPPKFRF